MAVQFALRTTCHPNIEIGGVVGSSASQPVGVGSIPLSSIKMHS